MDFPGPDNITIKFDISVCCQHTKNNNNLCMILTQVILLFIEKMKTIKHERRILSMKTSRLVIGIISCVLFLLISLQSCAAGIGNTLEENGEASGSAGFILAVCMLVAGIVGICCRKLKTGTIVAGVFYAFGGLVGITNVGSYADLQIWSILSFIFAAVFIVTGIMQKQKKLD